MGEIIIREKPNEVSFDTIHEILYSAHESTRRNGTIIKTSLMNAQQLEDRVGSLGRCFVAYDNDNIVGTASYRVTTRNSWYYKGRVFNRILIGVLPEYKGHHICEKLFNTIFQEAKQEGIKGIETRTAENNEIIQHICKKEGAHYVGFMPTLPDHYSVVMFQWTDGCPWPEWLLNSFYSAKRLLVKIRYKPDKKKRFGI